MKEYYLDEVNDISKKVTNYKDCFKFAVVADSHLDNSIEDTFLNIQEVDKNVNFRCLLHLGDFLNGNLSKRYTREILQTQMEKFCNSINGKCFYPVQGNHDGFADLTSPYSPDMAVDEEWYEATKFLNKYENTVRKMNKPYYYVDYTEDKIRIIVLCTCHYGGYYDGEAYEKKYGIDSEQIEWIENEALDIGEDWTVMIFSHDTPFKEFDETACINNPKINGNTAMNIIKHTCKKNGFAFAGWFVGHHHGDFIGKVNGINFILVASETAYIPQLFGMQNGGYYPERQLNTVTEDLWDAVVLDKNERKI